MLWVTIASTVFLASIAVADGRSLAVDYAAAVTELRSGKTRAAIAVLSLALKAQPISGTVVHSARTLRARLLMIIGRFDAAAAEWKALQPDGEKHVLALGLIAQRSKVHGWHGKAKCDPQTIAALDKLLHHAREDDTLYLLRGECQYVLRDLTAAHADGSLAHSLQPLEPRALLLLARVQYISMGVRDVWPSDAAVRCINRCLAIAPDYVDCAYWQRWLRTTRSSLTRAGAFEAEGKHHKALDEYRRVLSQHTSETTDIAGDSMQAALRRTPMPEFLRRRITFAMCSLSEAVAEPDGVIEWCGQLARSWRDGEHDVQSLIASARASAWMGRAQLQRYEASRDSYLLSVAEWALGDARSILSMVWVSDEIRGELDSLYELCSQIEEGLSSAQDRHQEHWRQREPRPQEERAADPHAVLEVEHGVTLSELKAAYRNLALKWHPDKYEGDDPEGALIKFREIANAFEELAAKVREKMAADSRERDAGESATDSRRRWSEDPNDKTETPGPTRERPNPFDDPETRFNWEVAEQTPTCDSARRGFENGWREGWRWTDEGWRQRVFMPVGDSIVSERRWRSLAIDKPNIQSAPAAAHSVHYVAGDDHINISFVPPSHGPEPTVFYLMLLPRDGDEDKRLCLASLLRPPRTLMRSWKGRDILRISAQGLSPGTNYDSIHVVSCTSLVEPPLPSGCAFHPEECSEHALSSVSTRDPAIEGKINEGSFDGGGWVLVRRVGPGTHWHPAEDDLTGTAEYGGCGQEQQRQSAADCGPASRSTFSLRFDHIAWEQMLFSSGDGQRWLQMDRPTEEDDQRADSNGYVSVSVSKSYLHGLPYAGRVRMDSGEASEPLVRSNLRPSAEDPLLYAEASRSVGSPDELHAQQGASVWVRPWTPVSVQPATYSSSAPGRRTADTNAHHLRPACPTSDDVLGTPVESRWSRWDDPSCTSGCYSPFAMTNAPRCWKRWDPVEHMPNCTDEEAHCPSWAQLGECLANWGYMAATCCQSCTSAVVGESCTDQSENCTAWGLVRALESILNPSP